MTQVVSHARKAPHARRQPPGGFVAGIGEVMASKQSKELTELTAPI
jgi:hypothetical protein